MNGWLSYSEVRQSMRTDTGDNTVAAMFYRDHNNDGVQHREDFVTTPELAIEFGTALIREAGVALAMNAMKQTAKTNPDYLRDQIFAPPSPTTENTDEGGDEA